MATITTSPHAFDVAAIKAATGRTYPEGYGFALTYLDPRQTFVNLDVLREAANACIRVAFRRGAGNFVSEDHAAYVAAAASLGERRIGGNGITHPAQLWIIEAAQLVLQTALSSRAPYALVCECRRALGACGHPGYEPTGSGVAWE